MDTIVVIVMGIVLSAFAVGEGYLARWDETERHKNRGKR